jgi:hypothetical protein
MAAFVIPAGEMPWATARSTFSAASSELRIMFVFPGKDNVTLVAIATLIKSLLFIGTPLCMLSCPLSDQRLFPTGLGIENNIHSK